MPYLDIFGLEFQRPTVIFEITILEFVLLQNFAKQQKCRNLGLKMPYLGILGRNFKKAIGILEINTLEFV